MSDEKFDANYIIEDHFDAIINQLDIHVEEAIIDMNREEEIHKINKLRSELLLEISIIKNFNLTFNASLHAELERDWQRLLSNKSIKYLNKLETIKKDLIRKDCVLMTNSGSNKCQFSIWIFNSYSSSTKHVNFLR